MAQVAEKYRKQLTRIKKNVEKSYVYSKDNCDRYHQVRKMVFETALSDDDISLLKELNKPQLEFNVLNAYVSRLCGEFSKQEPSITVTADNGIPVNPQVIEAVDGHLRHILFEAKKRNTQYEVYKDQLSGGFSGLKVWTQYANPMSFDQVICLGRVYEPTLIGFDPLARLPDKSDGQYYFEIYPQNKDVFKKEYPDVNLDDLSFNKSEDGFNWSYKSQTEDVVILCDYYEKKLLRKKIVKLANNQTMTMEDYEKRLEKWNAMGISAQPPAIVGSPRWTEIERICRYLLIGSEVIEYEETDFKYLPGIFVGGNSILLRESQEGAFKEFTKPYVWDAIGAQKLKNFAGITLADDIENMVQHKFMVAKEALPQERDYLNAYSNVQQANTLVYNSFVDNDPDKPIPNPIREVQRVPTPPEVPNTFSMTDQVIQSELGSYDAALGINDNQLSGVAIVEGATQSNAAAMPYVVAHMQALTHAAQIIVDLIPKYYVTKRTIPIITREGKRDYIEIDPDNGFSFNYDENALQVRVEAGVNFAIQKSRALQQIIAMSQASPMFAQFMNEEGLEVLLDNMEFRGSDILKEKATAWMQKMKQIQAQQAKMASQIPNPVQAQMKIEGAKLQQKERDSQRNAQLQAAKIAVDKQKADTDQLDVLAAIGESRDQILIQHDKAQAENTRSAVDLAIKAADLNHKVRQSNKGVNTNA
jgi:hypothetical protein